MSDPVRCRYGEKPLQFQCAGDVLFGIVACPERPVFSDGVLIVVGGPQYRVGSHRQFLLLSRKLAGAGIPVMRFDYRGMGDSTGGQRSFEGVETDIAAAIEAMQREFPGLRGIVLWGLCDAASAALLYWQATHDDRVRAICLLNPWVRSEASLARTQVRHYYGRRFLQPEFWRKLFAGEVRVIEAGREFLGKLFRPKGQVADGRAGAPFQARMLEALRAFPGEILLILSGNDYTAKEFIDNAAASPDWAGVLGRRGLRRIDIGDADHTFSSAAWRNVVESATLEWIAGIAERR